MLGLIPYLHRGLRRGRCGRPYGQASRRPSVAGLAARSALVCIIKPLLQPRLYVVGGAGRIAVFGTAMLEGGAHALLGWRW